MKIRLSLFCLALMALFSNNAADAQHLGQRGGLGIGGGQSAFRAVSGDLRTGGFPGRVWFEANFADRGLGYDGSYFTLGGKTRLFQDRLDGRWLMEGQVHHSIEDDGGFFANVGIERVFSIKAANADIVVGGFYDYDGDDQQSFSNGFHQAGVSGSIRTQRWDLIGNGYLPMGTDGYTLGDHTGDTCFVGNNIALQSGIESALQGFDVTLRSRPKQLAFANGYVDFGGYHYDSDLVDSFAGGRLRVGIQLLSSVTLAAEVNHDERFDTTGALSVGVTFGANSSGYGSEYAGLARDLEKTSRNDHIVRFSQDLILAVDPTTGLAYNVVHADNTALGGDGTYESPFSTLAAAEFSSAAGDIIYVAGGDGTDTGYDSGITLKDRQQLLSGGENQFIPIQDGTLLALSGKAGVSKATISNSGGNQVVRLANNNVIGGITIDAAGANYGVFGAGVEGGTFNGTMISGAARDGIGLQAVTGNWQFANNMSTGNGQDGVFINGAFDPNSDFVFTDNDFSLNGVDGLHIEDYDAKSITISNNSTDNNGRHGLYIENDFNSDAAGTDIDILTHSADGNGGNGIYVENGSGRLRVLDPTATNNAGAGLKISNFDNPLVGDFTLIGGTDTNVADFSNNAVGVDVELIGNDLTQNILLTQSRVDNNARGVLGTAEGAFTTLNFDIIDNISISNNENEGIRLGVDGGATINNRIQNIAPNLPLQMINNNSIAGDNLSYSLSGTAGAMLPDGRIVPISQINSFVRDVRITSAGGGVDGIDVVGVGDSQINLDVADVFIDAAGGIDIQLDNDNNGDINRTVFDNIEIQSDFGVFVSTGDGTSTDFSITNSTIRSNGTLAADGEVLDRANPNDYTPYGDNQGDFGIVVSAFGSDPLGGDIDNLTRVNIANNEINDFTFDGITATTSGDAQMLVNIESNQINRNGPGQNDDPDNDDTFPGPDDVAIDAEEEFFHSGIEINAFDNSVVSGRIINNSLVDNFERAIQINTTVFDKSDLLDGGTANPLDQGTINLLIDGNILASNIGFDDNNSFDPIPPINRFGAEIGVLNGQNANICLDLTTNVFEDIFFPIDVTNFGAAASVQLGFEGASNGFVATDVFGTFTEVPFGTCVDAIEIEELFFQVSGMFPPNGH